MSTTHHPCKRRQALVRKISFRIDLRGRLGWALCDLSDALQRTAHRVTGGETPTSETLHTGHLRDVSAISGIPVSDLFRGSEVGEATRMIAARTYSRLVEEPFDVDKLDALADAIGVPWSRLTTLLLERSEEAR